MKIVEIIAKDGYKLTQVAEVSIENRIYASKVYTPTPEAWHKVPISEFEEWETSMEKLNPIIE